MARSIVSPGMLWARAARTAVRRRGLALTSPPPRRAATVISLISFVKTLPRLASLAAFLCLMVLHLEWPDIGRFCALSHAFRGNNSARLVEPRRPGDARDGSAR